MLNAKIKKSWESEMLMLFASMSFTTAIAFIRVPELSSKIFVYTNLFDYIYCIIGITNLILWLMSLDKAKLAMHNHEMTFAQLIIYWYIPLVLYILYYAFFPVMMGR